MVYSNAYLNIFIATSRLYHLLLNLSTLKNFLLCIESFRTMCYTNYDIRTGSEK